MKQATLLTSVAALSLLFAGMAMAQEAPAETPSASTCAASPPTTWAGWGLDPYASSEEEALTDAKLDRALADAVNAGCFTATVAAKIKEAVRAHPDGTSAGGTPAILPPGYRLDMMETGSHGPMFNVTVGRRVIGRGQVRAVEAKVWAVSDGNRVYMWFLPGPCNNWSLLTLWAARPIEPDCEEVLIPGKPGDSITASRYFSDGAVAPSVCDAWMRPGESTWRVPPTRCPQGPCVPLPRVNGVPLQQSGGWEVEGRGGWYRIRVSREFAERGLLYVCRTRGDVTSCGVKVQRDDYPATGPVVVHYSLSAATRSAATTSVTRPLYFQDGNCPEE